MIAIGIDPGLKGGIAILAWPTISVFPMPILPYGKTGKGNVKNAVDGAHLASAIGFYADFGAHVFLERVGAMPGQGGASMFSFGMSYGIAIGVVQALGMPLTLVAPQTWKAHFKLPSEKKLAIGLASRLYPGLSLNEGTAEALLIARYGLERANPQS